MEQIILVVDDYEPIQNMYVDVLERCNFETLRASNGEEALRMIYSQKPDVVLLDVDLPRSRTSKPDIRGKSTSKNQMWSYWMWIYHVCRA